MKIQVDALTPSMQGVWIVKTQGTTHVFDLDRKKYTRRPGPNSLPGGMRHDGQEMTLDPEHVTMWPRVGGVFLIHYFGGASYRRSSQIESITRYVEEIEDE